MNPTLLKARQAQKIAEIGEALRAAGIRSLEEQTEALGLSRSTTYHVVSARHKASGISARIIMQMLRSPRLPLPVREAILDYARAKIDGAYSDNKRQLERFRSRLDQEHLTCR
jgi:hypothetical protein